MNAYYRNSDFFTSRDGEEDDDHPNFTGYDAIEKKIVFALQLHSNEFEIEDEEKSWFTIRIHL